MRKRHLSTVAVLVLILMAVAVVPIANAECDPSHGLHPGLALKCFLEWLMDVFGAGGPY